MPEPDRTGLDLLDPDGAFRTRLAADRRALEQLAAGLWRLAPSARQQRLAAIESLAHGLAGAGGTFGFVAIGEAALALEDLLIEQRQGLLAGEPAAIDARLAALLAALQ
jgi:HPt (histidine-containing phosphotransfer) domain-containing protein